MTLNRQFILFVCVGVACAVIDVSTMQLLILLGCLSWVSVSIGFAVGLVANYAFHARLTFKKVGSIASIFKFSIVALSNYLITLFFVFISLQIMDGVMFGKIVSLPIIAVNGFLLSRYWVFK